MLDKLSAVRPDWVSTCLVLGFTLLFGYYNYATWHFRIFKKLGIKGPRPIPILGNMLDIRKLGVLKYDLDLKMKYGPIIGCFFGKTPTLVIHDLNILKQIMVKDFHLFPNRLDLGFFGSPINKMIVFLKDDHWRRVRAVLAPTFSSGKMRKMSPQLIQCCETLTVNLTSKAETGEVFDFRELCGTYTMDVIASTAFGIEIDSHNDPKNEFVTKATKLFKFKLNGPMLLFMIAPVLYRFFEKFGFTIMEKSTTQFFFDVVERAVEGRGEGSMENGQTDFLQLVIQAQQENEEYTNSHPKQNGGVEKINKGITNDELLAQGFLFFLAGFETTASTLSLFVHSVALYPEIQERLYEEILEKLGQEEPNYDSIKDLEYLEMCFSETLRMYPAGPRTDRVAAKDVTIDGLFIPKGMVVIIPIHSIQNDPEYWEKPEVFNPERFHPSVRSKIDPMRYMPFGLGPRNCVGMRLAVLELKMAIVKMMRRFKFVASDETKAPLEFEAMSLRTKNGIKIRVEKRK